MDGRLWCARRSLPRWSPGRDSGWCAGGARQRRLRAVRAGRDAAVAEQVELVATGSPYAVAPGRVTKADGDPYRVFTPYFSGGSTTAGADPRRLGVDAVGGSTRNLAGCVSGGDSRPAAPGLAAGERAALSGGASSATATSTDYDHDRDRPDLDATSRMSVYLKYGTSTRAPCSRISPRRAAAAPRQYRRQLAWREFYADVLFHRPDTRAPQLDRVRRDPARHRARRRRLVRCVVRGPHRVPDRRCRHAAAARRGRGCTTGCG